MYGIEIPKQRGIYSEILTTEDTENLRVSILASCELILIFCVAYNRKYRPSDPIKPPLAR